MLIGSLVSPPFSLFVVSLDYSAHASSEYGKVLAGGATLNKNNAKASTTITGRAPGKTTTSGAYTYTTREYVGNNQYASCSASSSSSDGCSNGNVARSLQTAAVANTGEGATSRPTVTLPPPRLQRYDQRDNLQPRATASCSRKSDKDRSKDKARTARRAVDSAKDLIDGFDDAEDIAQAIKDAARLGLAGALAAAAAADLLSDDDDSSGNRDDVYADASSALSAAAPMRTYSDSDVQEAYTDLSVAATEASSAADIASTYLPSKPTATTTSTTAKPTTAPTTTTTAKPSTQPTSKATTSSTSTAPQPTYAPPSGGCYGEGDKARNPVWNPLCSGDQELRAYFNTRRAHTILAKGSKGFAPLFLFGDRASQIDKVYPCINKDAVGDDFKIISDELIFDHAYQTQTRRGLNDTLDDGIFEGIEGLVNVASPLVGQDIFLHPL
ncbi:hypothetical protein FA10DRAFT_182081 [Acaromyces ingoldii]|uniref:Uncharacterized protein n=1 Tax=Acaromyces ingoldii TaxID=215250 RepID=A0A316YFW9_9BASI|nr:hypothetical protein FA10DRAFT_182081 [Acaromyces ingoldii]PWN88021.1 hypothetical protein FA10DRAFT_182081 [Acaromyces ingoldii]